MCQQIIKFCSGSTRPLLFVGSFFTLSLAIAIAYIGYTTDALYNDIDPSSKLRSLSYYLQLAAAGYLALLTLLGCYAAYYDQKHSIRALTVITSINFVLALAAIAMVPPGDRLFDEKLKEAQKLYDFRHNSTQVQSSGNASQSDGLNTEKTPSMSKAEATKIWDSLQKRGCCGMRNGTSPWPDKIPKSCCNNSTSVINESGEISCNKTAGLDHQTSCQELIESTSMKLIIVLALIGLVNFYMAITAGVNAYRTFHYNEANQGAYT